MYVHIYFKLISIPIEPGHEQGDEKNNIYIYVIQRYIVTLGNTCCHTLSVFLTTLAGLD